LGVSTAGDDAHPVSIVGKITWRKCQFFTENTLYNLKKKNNSQKKPQNYNIYQIYILVHFIINISVAGIIFKMVTFKNIVEEVFTKQNLFQTIKNLMCVITIS